MDEAVSTALLCGQAGVQTRHGPGLTERFSGYGMLRNRERGWSAPGPREAL